MKVLPIIKCSLCRTFIEFGADDVREVTPGQRYILYCPVCNSTLNINTDLVLRLLDQKTIVLEDEPAPETPSTDDPDDEKVAKALRAQAAIEEHGTQAAAAKALGVSAPTVANWLKNLPEKVSAQD